jgi:hypothetical protein
MTFTSSCSFSWNIHIQKEWCYLIALFGTSVLHMASFNFPKDLTNCGISTGHGTLFFNFFVKDLEKSSKNIMSIVINSF